MNKKDIVLSVVAATLLVAVMPLWVVTFLVLITGSPMTWSEASPVIAAIELAVSVLILAFGIYLLVRFLPKLARIFSRR